MSVTKKFLLGAGTSHSTLTSYAIHSNGSLTKASSVEASKYQIPETGCGNTATTQVDASGTTLYYFNCAGDNNFLSFHIESNGDLQFLGKSGGTFDDTDQGGPFVLSMPGNNHFAFDSNCEEDEGDTSVIDTYKRESNGNLLYIGQENQTPEPAPGTSFCVGTTAADASSHLAVAFQRIDSQPHDAGYIDGPYFIASYSVDSSGDLTTQSTYENMPSPAVAQTNDVSAMSISPDGKYIAVGGGGFQVLHFNGSNPATNFSAPMLVGTYIEKFGWDKASHLYVLASTFGASPTTYLHVYTVTSSGVKESSGSPYSIPQASNVIVRDLQ
jgi:hypothetical protein